MHYTLHQLMVFLKITETKSITKAAKALNLTQPAVSIQFKNFQEQFEIPLLEFSGKKMRVTGFGLEIAEAAADILTQIESIQYKTQIYKGLFAGKIKFASVSTGKYVLPYFLSDFNSKYPKIELTIDVTNKNKVIESLDENNCDFALITVIPEDKGYFAEKLVENRLYCIAPTAFGSAEEIKTRIFNGNISFIFRELGSGTRTYMENFLKRYQISNSSKLELSTNEAVKQAILAGLGCSVMPLIGLKNELNNKELQIIDLPGLPLKSDWCLVYRKDKNLQPAAAEFLRFVRAQKNTILDKHFTWLNNLKTENTIIN